MERQNVNFVIIDLLDYLYNKFANKMVFYKFSVL